MLTLTVSSSAEFRFDVTGEVKPIEETELFKHVLKVIQSLHRCETAISNWSRTESVEVVGKGQSVFVISQSIHCKDAMIRCLSFEDTARQFIYTCREVAARMRVYEHGSR